MEVAAERDSCRGKGSGCRTADVERDEPDQPLMLAAATNLLKLCLGIIYGYLFPLTLKFELRCFYRKGSGTAQRQ